MASNWKNKLRGYKQIQDGTIEESQIAATRLASDPRGLYVGIPEAKLNLDIPTQSLLATSLQINANTTVADTTVIVWPALYLKDVTNGKTYKLYTSNGTIVTEEVPS